MKPWSLSGVVAACLLASVLMVGSASSVSAAAEAKARPVLRADDGFTWRGAWSRVKNFVHNSFRSRARLVQISALAVALGLFIMFRARNT